jgi:prephenate dehydrogenase
MRMSLSVQTKTVILGGAGAVGTLFASRLAQRGPVTVVDLSGATAPDFRFIACDALEMSSQARETVAEADLVLLTLPEAACLRALPGLFPLLRSDALLVDTMSIKSEVVRAIQEAAPKFEALSINPMFAPDLGFMGQRAVAIEISAGAHAACFLAWLEQEGCRVVHVPSAEEHDRAMAAMQAMTHACIIAAGVALQRLGTPISTILDLAPPPHRTLLCLLARILSAAPEVYWDIQSGNPFAATARDALADGIATLAATVRSPDDTAFDELLAGLSAYLAPHVPYLGERCAELFAVHARSPLHP